jgi:dTDP-glucose 4,6-dehydratase
VADTLVITGGAGFIGSNLVRRVLAHSAHRVVVLDKLTYAANPIAVDELRRHPRVTLIADDIANAAAVNDLFRGHQPIGILNLAAETHVDRSIDGPGAFIDTNLRGTFVLLEAARAYTAALDPDRKARFRFLHVSTDEVYGSLGVDGSFSEQTAYAPNSPYAASKAGADHLVRAYFHTYGLPTLITNCSNNYGPFQHPEKLIPLTILNALDGRRLPIYGDGGNVRDWLHVDDHCAAILDVLDRGRPGQHYNIGADNERTNVAIVDSICDTLETLVPAASNAALTGAGVRSYRDLKTFVADRPGHDRRYAVDATKLRTELGWTPRHTFEAGLRETAAWYIEHRDQLHASRVGYDRERLGLGAPGANGATSVGGAPLQGRHATGQVIKS